MWDQLQEPAYRLLADEYGRDHAVAPRAWFFGTQMGEQSFLTLHRADKQYEAKAMVGLSPQEAKLTHPDEALMTDDKGKRIGRWFQPGDDRVVILPDSDRDRPPHRAGRHRQGQRSSTAAKSIPSSAFSTRRGSKSIADLDNELITPVDFIAMNKLSAGAAARAAAIRASRSTPTWSRTRCSSSRTRRAINRGAELRSIAIDFGDPKQVLKRLDPLMHRLGLNLYAGRITNPNNADPRTRHDRALLLHRHDQRRAAWN